MYKAAALVAIVAAIVFGLSVFFRINTIEVIGISRYNAEEIKGACGIKIGDNLLLLDKIAGVEKLFKDYPYIKEVKLLRSLPDKLVISVTESKPVAYVSSEKESWLIDIDGRLLESVPPTELSKYCRVTGMTIVGAEVGGELYVTEDQEGREKTLVSVLSVFADLMADMRWIDMSKDYDVRMQYGDRIQIKLGVPTELDKKRQFFDAVINSVDKNNNIILDISDAKVVREIPN